jgi:Polyketide cyclase / dehydrase and lipid transport
MRPRASIVVGARRRESVVIRIEQSVVIDRPLAEVFAFAADPANDPAWNEPIVATRLLTAGPVGVGTIFQHSAQFLGQRFETTVELTEYELGMKACVKTVGGPLQSTGCRVFAAVGEATRLTVSLVGEASGLFRLGEGIAARAARRQLDGDLARLKALLEARR